MRRTLAALLGVVWLHAAPTVVAADDDFGRTTDAALHEADRCKGFVAPGGSLLAYVKCMNGVTRHLIAKVNPACLDIYEDGAAQKEVVGADFDAGKLTVDQAITRLNAIDAATNRAVSDRELKR